MADGKITINDVAASLISMGDRLEAQWKALNWALDVNAHKAVSWQAHSISLNELKQEIKYASDRILTLNNRTMSAFEAKYTYRIKLRSDEIQFGNLVSDVDAMIGSVLEIVNSVFRNIPLPPPPKVDWEDLKKERDLLPKDLVRRLRSIEARLQDLEPRSALIEKHISDIESAHHAAEQLPTDLADLASQREHMQRLAGEAARLSDAILAAHTRAEDGQHRIESIESNGSSKIDKVLVEAEKMIQRSEQALRGSTSVGLARAFAERSQRLGRTGAFWTACLALSLLVALFVGAYRLHELKYVLDGSKSSSIIWANLILTALGVGAPVWFAWLATRQIGTTFKLAEDYAFKASVSQAYEGYRAEAVDIDPLLRERLFSSALTRIEEAPIRLVDDDMHNSPLSEILANSAIRKSLESIPGISEKILALIPFGSNTASLATIDVTKKVVGETLRAGDGENVG